MASPVVSVINQISTDWEALTPPTKTSIAYAELDGRTVPTGGHGHRKFWFEASSRGEPVLETSSSTLVTWELTANLLLSASGQSVQAKADAFVNESNLLARAIETRTSWPANVAEVFSESVEQAADDETDDLIARFTIRATVWETD